MIDDVLDLGAAHAWTLLTILAVAALVAGLRRYGRRLEQRTRESSGNRS